MGKEVLAVDTINSDSFAVIKMTGSTNGFGDLTMTFSNVCRSLKVLPIFMASLVSISGCGHAPEKASAVAVKMRLANASDAPVRQNITDAVNDAELMTGYRKAIDLMRKNSEADPATAEFRTSLQFWANTHGYFGEGGNATNYSAIVDYRLPQCLTYFRKKPYSLSAAEAKEVCEKYYAAASQTFTPDKYSEGIWGTCQHTPRMDEHCDDACKAVRAEPRFLPWHRLYLYYYERTLRKLSGNPNFALPYWDYFDYPADATKGNLLLPPLVTEGGSVEKNSFFDGLRTLGLNERMVSMTPDNATATDAFAEPLFVGFSNVLEGEPHGAMHCAVGNGCTTPHIGWVPVAGNDPVFYMHHANIDRLWQCWMQDKANGQKIDLAWAKRNLGMSPEWFDITFDFADENGNRVTHTIADAFSPEVMAVRYAEEVNCRIAPDKTVKDVNFTALKSLDAQIEDKGKVFAAGKVDLPVRAITVPLLAETDAPRLKQAGGLLESLGETSPGVWLVLENIVVKRLPDFTYNVYISHKDRPGERALVTRFNFFGFGDHGAHGHSMSLGTQRHYLNDDMAELNIVNKADILVQFVPSHGVTGELLESNEDSPISIDSIRLIAR
jgi:tyrosinase